MASRDVQRAQKSAQRAEKRQQRRETWSNVKQAFTLTRQADARLIPYMVGAGVAAGAAVFVILFFVASWWMGIVAGVLVAVIAALFVFSRRAQRSMFSQAEGQPGAAGWMLSQRLRGDWRITQAVAGTAQLDAVHRLVGRPGIVLVGEGAQQRVRGLIAAEKRTLARVAGDTPIYDFVVGTADGEVRLAQLNRKLIGLPANLSKDEVRTLEKRLAALSGGRMPLPQGPIPTGAKMRNVQRAARRSTRG